MKIFRNNQSGAATGILVALALSMMSLAPLHALAQDNNHNDDNNNNNNVAASPKPLDLISLGTASVLAGDNLGDNSGGNLGDNKSDNQNEVIIYDPSQTLSDITITDVALVSSLAVDTDRRNVVSPVIAQRNAQRNTQLDTQRNTQSDVMVAQNTKKDTTPKDTKKDTPKGTPKGTPKDTPSDAKIQTLESTSAAYGSAKLGRRKISDIGLAAIGVSDTTPQNGALAPQNGTLAPQNSTLDSLIWRGTPAKNAAFLLENGAVANQSPSLSALAYDVVARQSVPPMGANMIAGDLVRARLAWLARAGRSDDLAVLVEQLPDNEKWASWKRWLVEHHLMRRRDDIACATVAAQIAMTLDPFWHQAKVICDAVQGDMGSAQFAADVLAATGMGDPTFMGLIDELFTGTVFEDIDPTTLDTIHIVLMEALHRPIPIEGIAIMPPQMAQTITSLRYLSDDARMVSTYDGLQRGLVSPREAGKLWRSTGASEDNPQSALARLDSEVSALTSAMAWRALDVDESNAVFGLIVAAMKREIAAGNGSLMLPLYAELAINALAVMQSQTAVPALVDVALDNNATLTSSAANDNANMTDNAAVNVAVTVPTASMPDEAVLADIDVLLALADPAMAPAIFAGSSPIADHIRILLTLNAGDVWDADSMQTLDIWHLQPLLHAAGINAPDDISWFDLLQSGTHTASSREKLSPILLRACGEAAAKKRVAETILLASWLLQSTDFSNIDPVDAGLVIQYLRDVGQDKVAMSLMREIARAHLMAQFMAGKQDADADAG